MDTHTYLYTCIYFFVLCHTHVYIYIYTHISCKSPKHCSLLPGFRQNVPRARVAEIWENISEGPLRAVTKILKLKMLVWAVAGQLVLRGGAPNLRISQEVPGNIWKTNPCLPPKWRCCPIPSVPKLTLKRSSECIRRGLGGQPL